MREREFHFQFPIFFISLNLRKKRTEILPFSFFVEGVLDLYKRQKNRTNKEVTKENEKRNSKRL